MFPRTIHVLHDFYQNKFRIFSPSWPGKGLLGPVVNLACPFLHGRLLVITHTVPLRNETNNLQDIYFSSYTGRPVQQWNKKTTFLTLKVQITWNTIIVQTDQFKKLSWGSSNYLLTKHNIMKYSYYQISSSYSIVLWVSL